MSELNHGPNHEAFETEDLSPQGVFYFMAGIAVLGVVIYFILVGMYRFLDAYDRSHQPHMNPMAIKTGADPQTMTFRDITNKLENTFPKPVLEYSERTQFIEELDKQDKTLATYDWVDQKNGVARIPIERAMDLLVQRGLPVLPQGEAHAGKPGTGAGSVTSRNSATSSNPGASGKPGKTPTPPPK